MDSSSLPREKLACLGMGAAKAGSVPAAVLLPSSVLNGEIDESTCLADCASDERSSPGYFHFREGREIPSGCQNMRL